MEKINKLLIANRGEIACRIIKTARSMGIYTVAIYSSVDRDNLHVTLADTAYCVGDAPAKESYLNIPQIIQVIFNSLLHQFLFYIYCLIILIKYRYKCI